MSLVAQDELKNLTNDQLRQKLLQHGLSNVPVTNSTREILLKRLRKTLEAQKSDTRRETIHVTRNPTDEEKNESRPGPLSKKVNRRNTVNAIPMTAEDVVPIVKPKNIRRSGRITPTMENGNAAPIAIPPSENDIIELDEEFVRETYVPPKRTSRSPSLGKSQTVVTSYKTEVAKPNPIVESTEEEEEEGGGSYEEETGRNLYPSLSINGFKNFTSTKQLPSTLRRTTTHTTAYEPTSYKPLYEEINDVPFKARSASASNYIASSSSGLNRRYTTNTCTSRYLNQNNEDDSGTEQSDIDAPYLSDFAKRLSQLRPEPIHKKIIADVKQHHHHHQADDSLWQSFSNLVIAFGRKFGSIFIFGITLMIVVFIYVFFIQ